MGTGPKPDGRGGARAGAGRKPSPKPTLSAEEVGQMLKAAKKYAKKYGISINEILLDMIYTADLASQTKLAAIRLFKELTMAKPTEGGVIDKALAPAVFLPEHRPPTLEIVKGEKVA